VTGLIVKETTISRLSEAFEFLRLNSDVLYVTKDTVYDWRCVSVIHKSI